MSGRVRPVVVVARAFVKIDESEPFLRFLRHISKESIPIFLHHFGLAPDTKPKSVPGRSLFHRGLNLLYRPLTLWSTMFTPAAYTLAFLAEDSPSLITGRITGLASISKVLKTISSTGAWTLASPTRGAGAVDCASGGGSPCWPTRF